MNPSQRKEARRAQRALRDCEVVRVTIGRVPLGYRLLQREGLIKATRAKNDPDKADCRLTPAGRKEEIKP